MHFYTLFCVINLNAAAIEADPGFTRRQLPGTVCRLRQTPTVRSQSARSLLAAPPRGARATVHRAWYARAICPPHVVELPGRGARSLFTVGIARGAAAAPLLRCC